MLRSLTTRLHDDDPFKPLAFEAPLGAIRAKLTNDNRYFEKLIETYLLGESAPHNSPPQTRPGLWPPFRRGGKGSSGEGPRDADRRATPEDRRNHESPQKATGDSGY
ncbi:MAG: hypothetical protein M0C28_28885 [Candidatus Moduliflexus flocculans]|nr:hypothetical protein [Candidatus Moduliflexus flocculans]